MEQFSHAPSNSQAIETITVSWLAPAPSQTDASDRRLLAWLKTLQPRQKLIVRMAHSLGVMRLHRFVTAVALTAFVGTEVVALSPALAWGGGGGPGNIYVPLPPELSPWPQVPQVPIFGGQNTSGPPPQSSPHSPQAPGEGTATPSSNSSRQIERSP
jgi:hypothetical protein